MNCWQQAKMLYKYRGSLHTRMHTHTPPDEQNQSSGTAELRLRKAGLSPLRLVHGVDGGLLDEFLYRLYGMYLAVLAARMAAGAGDQPGHGDSLFPE